MKPSPNEPMYWSRGVALLAFASLALLLWLGTRELFPPSPKGGETPPDQFSAERAMRHVRRIAAKPHPIGSEAHRAVREYLLEELRALGLEPQVQIGQTAQMSGEEGETQALVSLTRLYNIVARRPGGRSQRGEASGPAIVLASHYDSVISAPGAADDASGVATTLETIRALNASDPIENDVIVLITDGEEAGLLGARLFCSEHPWAADVGLVLNFEARGGRGASFMFETSAGNALVSASLAAVPTVASSSIYYETYKRMPNNTDLSVFKAAGMLGLNFAFIGGLSQYHTMRDSADRLDLGSLQHHGNYASYLTRALGSVDLATLKVDDDAVYFSPLGRFFIHYSTAWVIPLWLLSTLLFAGAIGFGVRKEWIRRNSFAKGVAVTAVGGLLSVGVWFGIYSMVVATGGVARFVPVLAEAEERYMLGVILLGVSLSVVILLMARVRSKIDALWGGALFWWWLLGTIATFALPLGAYLFVWPVLFASIGLIGLIARPRRQRVGIPRALAIATSIAPGVILFLPMVWGLFLSQRLPGGGIVVVMAALTLGLATPLVLFATSHSRWIIPTLTGVGGFAVLGYTLLATPPAAPNRIVEVEGEGQEFSSPEVEIIEELRSAVEGTRRLRLRCRLPDSCMGVTLTSTAPRGVLHSIDQNEVGALAVRYRAPPREFELEVSLADESALVISASYYASPQSEEEPVRRYSSKVEFRP